MAFVSVEEALEDIRQGKMIILVDDEDRENEGDLCMAAEKATPEAINFMAKYGRGLICLSLTPEKIEKLGLDMMARNNTSPLRTAFTVSIEARCGVTTGISAADRATTILTAGGRRFRRGRLGATRSCVPLAGPTWRSAGSYRSNRRIGGPGTHGGFETHPE